MSNYVRNGGTHERPSEDDRAVKEYAAAGLIVQTVSGSAHTVMTIYDRLTPIMGKDRFSKVFLSLIRDRIIRDWDPIVKTASL